jgi:serine/threonine-protein kinase PknG
MPLMQGGDPSAGFLAGLTIDDPDDLITALDRAPARSVEVLLLLARTQLRRGDADAASKVLDELDERYQGEWRAHWFRGVAALQAQQVADAWQIFDAIYSLLPGEIAPRLAVAFCSELYGDAATAGRYYTSIWRTDPAYVSAAFGSARVLMGAGDRDGALAVLDSVPETSSYRVPAQISAVATAVRRRDPDELAVPELAAAAERLERLQLDAERNAWLAAEVLEAAVTRVGSAGAAPPSLLGVPFTDEQLRRKLEQTYRTLARLSHTREDRHRLVDRANAVRPRTLV